MAKTLHPSAFEFIPEGPTLPKLREAAQACKACDLYEKATQAVVGVGPRGARAFFIGEQPGARQVLRNPWGAPTYHPSARRGRR